MAQHRSQRVQNLIENFMEYHNKGYSIASISEIFEVDFSTVYKHLQEIAEKNGFESRESLLVVVKSYSSSRSCFNREKIDIKKLQNDFEKIEEYINKVLTDIDSILTKEEDSII